MIISRNFRSHFRKTCIGISVLFFICAAIGMFFLETEPANADRQINIKPSFTQSSETLTTAILAEMANQNKQDELAVDYYESLAKQTKDPEFAKRAVYLALEDNKIELAIKPAELWASLSPENLEAQQTMASLLLAQNRLVPAEPYLEKALQLSSKSVMVSKFASSLTGLINTNSTLINNLIQDIAQKHPDDPKMLFYLSIFSGQLGNTPASISLIDQVLQKTPDDPEVISWKTQLMFKNGQNQAALDYLKNAIDRLKNDTLELLYAELLVNSHQLDVAKKLLATLSARSKVNPDVWLYSAQIARQENNLTEAANDLKKLETTSDNPDMAREMLGELYVSMQQPNEAITWFQKVGDGPYYFAAQMKAADLMAKQGQLSPALQMLSALMPTSYAEAKQLFILQSEIMIQNNEPENALKAIDKGLKLIPNDIQLLYYHALSAQQLENYALVESDLKQILAQDPNQVNALNILAFILSNHTTRYQEALGYINRAISIEPQNPSVLDSMGWVQFRLGNTEKALFYLKAAYSKNPVNEIGVHLAEVLWKSGDRSGAEDIFKKMLMVTPTNQALTDEIKKIKEASP